MLTLCSACTTVGGQNQHAMQFYGSINHLWSDMVPREGALQGNGEAVRAKFYVQRAGGRFHLSYLSHEFKTSTG